MGQVRELRRRGEVAAAGLLSGLGQGSPLQSRRACAFTRPFFLHSSYDPAAMRLTMLLAVIAVAVSGSALAGAQKTIQGSERPDRISGTPTADLILGFGGDDKVDGRGGPDRISGGEGDDRLDGF